jgi:hypothetical protein
MNVKHNSSLLPEFNPPLGGQGGSVAGRQGGWGVQGLRGRGAGGLHCWGARVAGWQVG